ncbi:uncharacterized protein [Fopius arisanus]|uniref:Uncharacterized protein isoform X2 n=1 Tax=Fopius arisanus TaxID=64838 RepID=A0A9R1T5T7_9HYME|nr:PREDICTED: uncharacterized protein LOC105266606 isoform X2 [Fopius arisanus]
MKLFSFVCALQLLFQVEAAESEINFYSYTMVNSELRESNHNMSTFMISVSYRAQNMSQQFLWGIDSLRAKYREDAFLEKYETKLAELAKNVNSSNTCPQYLNDRFEENRAHQNALSNYIFTAVNKWSKEFNNLNQKLAILSVALGVAERKAYECIHLFDGDDPTGPFTCVMKCLEDMKKMQAEAIDGIHDHMTQLAASKHSELETLHISIANSSIPTFYELKGIDQWLEQHCSE